MNEVHFAYPRLLWLLLIIIPVVAYYIWRTWQGGAAIRLSDTTAVRRLSPTLRYYARHMPVVLRCAAIGLIVIALARPQRIRTDTKSTAEGIDIVLAIDISSSMLARDFRPDRISAAREVAARFVIERHNDRIGLVAFAGESFTQCPLTTDKRTLLGLLNGLHSGMVEDGTAIGNGLATAVNRLRDSEAKSKVVILLTDGVNNRGQIAPLTASEIAEQYGIKVYTIGVGSMGTAPSPMQDMFGRVTFRPMKVEIDEDVLRKIAAQTGGEYFRATDNDKLIQIYDRINKMETTQIEVDSRTVRDERFAGFILAAMIALALEFIIRTLWLKQIP